MGTKAVPDSLERLAFGTDQVCALTGLSKRQLSYWDDTGFFSPELAGGGIVYSFRDLVGLRTIARLRETVPLQELRKVGSWLHREYEKPWSMLRFYRSGRDVHFRDPDSGKVLAAKPERQTVCIEMEEIAVEVSELVAKRRRRARNSLGKVEQRRQIVQNRPVIAGTRIPVEAIWNFHEEGYTQAAILKEYPTITARDVKAAIEYMRSAKAS